MGKGLAHNYYYCTFCNVRHEVRGATCIGCKRWYQQRVDCKVSCDYCPACLVKYVPAPALVRGKKQALERLKICPQCNIIKAFHAPDCSLRPAIKGKQKDQR